MSSKKKKTTEPEESTETKYLEAISFETELPTITRQPMYAAILKHVVDSNEKLAKIDASKLDVKVLTLYYGLKAVLNDSVHKDKYKLHIRKSNNQVWIEKK
jgi:hypothetical protein